MGILLTITIGFIAATIGTAVVIFQQYPAKVSIPDSVVGMNRSDELTASIFRSTADDADAQEFIRKRSMLIQAYTSKDGKRAALLVTGTQLILFPATDLSLGLREIAGAFELTGEVTDVPTGELGGAAACVNLQDGPDGERFVECGWADHGSLGIVTLVGAKDRDEAARWMLDIREAVVTR